MMWKHRTGDKRSSQSMMTQIRDSFTGNVQNFYPCYEFEIYKFRIAAISPRYESLLKTNRFIPLPVLSDLILLC